MRGCAAIERGPLVFFEQADQSVPLDELAVSPGSPLTHRPLAIEGIGRMGQSGSRRDARLGAGA